MLPNFFIIGAPKAGTTSLYFYLRQHPQIFMSPVKEPNFMAYDPGWLATIEPVVNSFQFRTTEQYATLFSGTRGETAVGEASPIYWQSPAAPARIKRYAPQAKLITILRHPVERFFSHYLMYRLKGVEPRTIEAAVAGTRMQGTPYVGQLYYLESGCYHRNLQRYWQHFPLEQVGVWFFDDLSDRPLLMLQSIFAFLGVEPSFEPEMGVRYNPSGIPKNRMLHQLLKKRRWTAALREQLPWSLIDRPYTWLMQQKEANLEKPSLDPALRRQLLDFYREDTLRLQDALGRDLSGWMG